MSLSIEVAAAADGERLLINVKAPNLGRGITIPLSQELSMAIWLLEKEDLERTAMATRSAVR